VPAGDWQGSILDCGGKRSATPLFEYGLNLEHPALFPKRRRRYGSAGAVQNPAAGWMAAGGAVRLRKSPLYESSQKKMTSETLLQV
jgi:hypothetical protein